MKRIRLLPELCLQAGIKIFVVKQPVGERQPGEADVGRRSVRQFKNPGAKWLMAKSLFLERFPSRLTLRHHCVNEIASLSVKNKDLRSNKCLFGSY